MKQCDPWPQYYLSYLIKDVLGVHSGSRSFVNAEGWYWYHSQLMCLFLLMINGSVVSSSGIEPPALHNHLWVYPRVLIVNISAFTGHQNFSRKIDLVNNSLQQKTGGENRTVFRGL